MMEQMRMMEQRLDELRCAMAKLKLDALIIPHDDEHLGEYTPLHCERLAWATGFTGSAGVAIVLAKRAVLFADGRYTIQAKEQSPEPLFEHQGLHLTPYTEWLTRELTGGARIGFDPKLHSYAWYNKTSELFGNFNLELVALESNLVDALWQDRPTPCEYPAQELAASLTGASSEEKRQKIATQLVERKLDAVVLTQVDSINWLLNIRGRDIANFPVVMGFAILCQDASVKFFTDIRKFGTTFSQHSGEGVELFELSRFTEELKILGQQQAKVQTDAEHSNAWCQLLLKESGATLINGEDPCQLPKAAKNEIEIDGMKQAHKRDAVAVCRFLSWLDRMIEAGERADEAMLADRIESYRKELSGYVEPSFDTISALGPNAAMCHYNFRNGTPRQMGQDGLYLVDSGGQYHDGTTDITRTVQIGDVSHEMRRLFTLVLKGHIAIDQARFPMGTSGMQLDVLARHALWQQGFDYAHGTGHGVGHFLSVHEGPQRIAPKGSSAVLQPGMILSNEPGYYRENGFGIRSENLLVVVTCEEPSEISMLRFEHLTLVPFDLRLVDRQLLTEAEIQWLNRYHAKVYRTISPELTGDELLWLEQATEAL